MLSQVSEILTEKKVNLLFDLFYFCFSDVVRFDNTYSWSRSKTIHYAVEVLEPELGEYYSTTDTIEEVFTRTHDTSISEPMDFFTPSPNILNEDKANGIDYQQGGFVATSNLGNAESEITRLWYLYYFRVLPCYLCAK